MENILLKKMFEMQRFNIIKTKLTKDTEHLIPNSYVYAWESKVYPFFDQSELHEGYEDCFTVTKDQVDIVTKYADQEWIAGKRYTFYQYEDYFRHDTSIDRYALIVIFRYCYLYGGFDELFWKTLISPMNYPAEASGITMSFNPDRLYLV